MIFNLRGGDEEREGRDRKGKRERGRNRGREKKNKKRDFFFSLPETFFWENVFFFSKNVFCNVELFIYVTECECVCLCVVAIDSFSNIILTFNANV